MSTSDNNNDQCGDCGKMKSSNKECTSCEQTNVNNITEGIDSVAIQGDISTCANCGKEGNSIDMNTCNKCEKVIYCNAACKKKHRKKHKKQCEEHLRLATEKHIRLAFEKHKEELLRAERAAELHDEELFKQPPPLEDCPICFLRMPTLSTGWRYQSCCGKVICSGCMHAPVYDNQGNKVDNKKCPFCRTPHPATYEIKKERFNQRVEANDHIAIYNQGLYYGLLQDMDKALELWHRAGELGLSEAYHNIGYAYDIGRGVEVDKKRAGHYYELAAMGGNAASRHNLGELEEKAGNIDRAIKHYIIAVAGGYSKSLKEIHELYSDGQAIKEDYTKALQLYQTYLGEVKSDQRNKAAAADERNRYY